MSYKDIEEEPFDQDENIADDDGEMYQLTPKGIALISMMDADLIDDMEDKRFNAFWHMFESDMQRLGYAHDE